ncbi:MAG TPA: hypothetical protein VMF89_25105, partial [Polyangiales bacterium]|nr:hypothetical protein [Polyangiales bacterium]
AADANADKEAAEWRLTEARKLEEAARSRVRDAEADVAAARRERDQVRASVESRQGELNELEQRLAAQRREFDELTQQRWQLLDSEKQRAQKLRSELDQARAELQRVRGSQLPASMSVAPKLSVETKPPLQASVATAPLPPAKQAEMEESSAVPSEPPLGERPSREQAVGQYAAAAANSDDDAEELIDDLEPLDIEDEVRERLEALSPAQASAPAPAPARSIEAGIDAMLNADPNRTLPPRAPANDVQPPKPKRRRGETAYSVNQVEEEDVYGTGRMPRPSREGGGRSGR